MTATDPALAADEAALLAAIVRTPDDDLPRLVFADWLEEHGQARRAEFIRRGCENAARFGKGRIVVDPVRYLVGHVAAAGGARLTFDYLATVRPWEYLGPASLSAVVVVGGCDASVTRSVCFHRGLPAG